MNETLSEHDLLFTRGRGIFTTCLVFDRKIFHFNEHMARLTAACEAEGINYSPL